MLFFALLANGRREVSFALLLLTNEAAVNKEKTGIFVSIQVQHAYSDNVYVYWQTHTIPSLYQFQSGHTANHSTLNIYFG